MRHAKSVLYYDKVNRNKVAGYNGSRQCMYVRKSKCLTIGGFAIIFISISSNCEERGRNDVI